MLSKQLAFGAVCLLGLGAVTQASLVAHESFESYTADTSVVGQGTASSGWTGAWTSNAVSGDRQVTEYSLSAGGITGGDQAVRLENIMGATSSNAGSALSRSFTRETGSVYASFLFRAESISGNEFINFYLSDNVIETGDANEMAGAGLMLNQEGSPFFVRYGSSASNTQVITSVKSTDPVQDFLVVLKVSKTSNQFYNTADLWLFDADDTASITEGTPTAHVFHSIASNMNGIDHFSVRVLNLVENESILFDEVRIGTDWASVVPVPEPGSLALLAPAVGLLMRRRNRKA